MQIRFIFTLILTIYCTLSYGQESTERLRHVSNNLTTIKIKKNLEDKAIIYGNFIRRKKFTSTGVSEFIVIREMESDKEYFFFVKPPNSNKDSNPFLFFLPEGEYQIINYGAIVPKAFGGYKYYTGPVFKRFDYYSEQNKRDLDGGLIDENAQERFSFEVKKGKVFYLGSWNFDSGYINFFDDKLKLDKKMKIKINKKVDYKNAIIKLPL